MELSKEHFDKQLAAHTARIERKVEEEVHGLATMVAKGFADIEKRLDVRERVDQLERKMTKVESALNVRL